MIESIVQSKVVGNASKNTAFSSFTEVRGGLLAFKPLVSYRCGYTYHDLINAGTLMIQIVPENKM